jgi:hypothetical protein
MPQKQMKFRISPRLHVLWLSVLLTVVAVSLVIYKHQRFGFPLVAKSSETVWTVEAELSFVGDGSPVRVSLALPSEEDGHVIMDEHFASPGYGFRMIDEGAGTRRGEWTRRTATGPQRLYYRVQFFRPKEGANVRELIAQDETAIRAIPYWRVPERLAVDAILSEVRMKSMDAASFVGQLSQKLAAPADDQNLSMLLSRNPGDASMHALFRDLLLTEGLLVRSVKGIQLSERRRFQPLMEGIEFFDGSRWVYVEPASGAFGYPERFLLWQRGGNGLLEVEGGRDSRVRFSVIEETRPAQQLAENRMEQSGDPLLDFSIYSLPIEEQNVFKHLILIPIGAFVIVILRNMVGVVTSGTFMPILVALAFQETRLLPGILLFVAIVTAGLCIRSLLTHLNLLVVPRVSAVVIVVILLMAGLSIGSHHLGWSWGTKVTFFPMIIISWTIERLSIIWEEEGGRSAVLQGGGSLLVAVIAYLAMSNPWVRHITFTFPELLLLVLAATLQLGQYSGYRLTELRRFEPFLTNHRS